MILLALVPCVKLDVLALEFKPCVVERKCLAKYQDVCSIVLSTLPSEHEAGIWQNQTGDRLWPTVLMEDLTVWPWASHLTSLTFTPHCGLGLLDSGDFSRCHFKSSHAHSTLCS